MVALQNSQVYFSTSVFTCGWKLPEEIVSVLKTGFIFLFPQIKFSGKKKKRCLLAGCILQTYVCVCTYANVAFCRMETFCLNLVRKENYEFSHHRDFI